MKIKSKKNKNLAIPGKPMTQEEFVSMIKDTEGSAFNTIEKSKEIFREWRTKLEK